MDKSLTNKKAGMNMGDLWTTAQPVVLGRDIAILVTEITIVAVATVVTIVTVGTVVNVVT